VNSLPKTVTRQRRDCNLNPGPSAPDSSALTTRLPSHPLECSHVNNRMPVFSRGCLLPHLGRTDVQWSPIRFSGSEPRVDCSGVMFSTLPSVSAYVRMCICSCIWAEAFSTSSPSSSTSEFFCYCTDTVYITLFMKTPASSPLSECIVCRQQGQCGQQNFALNKILHFLTGGAG